MQDWIVYVILGVVFSALFWQDISDFLRSLKFVNTAGKSLTAIGDSLNPNENDSLNGAKTTIRKSLGVDETLRKQEEAERIEALRNEVGTWYDTSVEIAEKDAKEGKS